MAHDSAKPAGREAARACNSERKLPAIWLDRQINTFWY
jgi:hypothetical protein